MTDYTPDPNRRAHVHNAISEGLAKANDMVPLSVRVTATRAALAEVDAWHAAGEQPAVSAPPADQNLRDRIAEAARTVRLRLGPNALAMAQGGEPIILNLTEADALADAVLPVLPAPADRAAVLREAVEVAGQMGGRFGTDDHGDHDAGWNDACAAIEVELRRMADEAQHQSRLTSPGRVYPDVMADCLRDDRRAMIAQFAAVLGDGNPAALRTVADRIAGQHQWIADVIRTEADRLDKKQQAEPDVCRPVDVDGEVILVRGSGEMTEQEQGYLASIVRAAKRKYAAEHDPDNKSV